MTTGTAVGGHVLILQRSQAGLAELRSVNREYPLTPIDTLGLQVERLADAHAGHRQ